MSVGSSVREGMVTWSQWGGEVQLGREWGVRSYFKYNLDVESLKSLVHDCREGVGAVLDSNLKLKML